MKPDFGLRSNESLTVGIEILVNDELITATSVIFPGEDKALPIRGEIFSTLFGFSVNGREYLHTRADMFKLEKFSDPEAEEIVAIEVETDNGIVTFFLNEYVPGEGWKFPE